MSWKKPDVARRLRRVKTETDKEIIASYEAQKNKVEGDKRGARKDGNKGKLRGKKKRKEPEEGEKKGMRKCEKV